MSEEKKMKLKTTQSNREIWHSSSQICPLSHRSNRRVKTLTFAGRAWIWISCKWNFYKLRFKQIFTSSKLVLKNRAQIIIMGFMWMVARMVARMAVDYSQLKMFIDLLQLRCLNFSLLIMSFEWWMRRNAHSVCEQELWTFSRCLCPTWHLRQLYGRGLRKTLRSYSVMIWLRQ